MRGKKVLEKVRKASVLMNDAGYYINYIERGYNLYTARRLLEDIKKKVDLSLPIINEKIRKNEDS